VHLRRALNGAYRWRKLKGTAIDRYDPEPDKNEASHIADALQYVALMEGGYERAKGRAPQDANAVIAMMQAQGLIRPRSSLIGHNGGPALRPMVIPR
jgi:hypothetical protein